EVVSSADFGLITLGLIGCGTIRTGEEVTTVGPAGGSACAACDWTGGTMAGADAAGAALTGGPPGDCPIAGAAITQIQKTNPVRLEPDDRLAQECNSTVITSKYAVAQ